VASGGSRPRSGQPGLRMGSGGPGSLSLRGFLEVAMMTPLDWDGGKVDVSAAGLPELYGPVWAQLGQCGPGVLLVFYPVDNRRSVVEVGSSHLGELLSPVPVVSCILTLQVTCHCSRRDGDGGCKIVVARVRGRWRLVLVLWCARVFLWAGVGRNPCWHVRPWRGAAFEWHHSLLEGVVGKPPSTLLRVGGNPRTIRSG
jgi:hypothetical protein